MDEIEIKCPICGGQLQYWKEYLVTKTQIILPDGSLRSSVKTSKPEVLDSMGGLECTSCGWVFNTVNEINFDGVEHSMKWLDENINKIKV